MKFRMLVILGLFFCNYSKAQNLSSKKDSITHIYSYTDLLPPEFTSSALENLYYGDSGPNTVSNIGGYTFVFRFRSNFTFFYEIYYRPYDTARVGYYIGKYTVSGNRIHLTYSSMLPSQEGKSYVSPSIPVSWTLPERPVYLSIKNNALVAPTTKRQKRKIRYTLKDKSQFDFKKM